MIVFGYEPIVGDIVLNKHSHLSGTITDKGSNVTTGDNVWMTIYTSKGIFTWDAVVVDNVSTWNVTPAAVDAVIKAGILTYDIYATVGGKNYHWFTGCVKVK